MKNQAPPQGPGDLPAAPAPDDANDPVTAIHRRCEHAMNDVSECLAPAALQAAARKMGIWRGGHVCLHAGEHEAYLSMFLEYCLLDLDKNGKTALERYRAIKGAGLPPDSEQAALFDALAVSRLSLFRIAARPDAEHALLKDVSDGSETIVFEPRMWQEIDVDALIVARLLTLDGTTHTTGRLVVLATAPEEQVPTLPTVANAKQARERAVFILRPLLAGAAEEAHGHGHGHDHHGHDHG